MTKLRVKAFESTCVVDEEGRKANLASALARGLPVCTQLPERIGSLALVGSGPSVRDHLNKLKSWDGAIWAVNGAYRYLLDNGVVADFIGMDPLPGLAEYVDRADERSTFYIASTCDPSVFDKLKDRTVMLWHPEAEGMKYPKGEWIIGGGTTALTRVPYLGMLLGWRKIVLFGADSSFENGRIYCYDWGTFACDVNNSKVWIEVNGEGPFQTELGLMKQVAQLGILKENFRDKMEFQCGGLMDAFLRSPVMDETNLEIENAV